jgi:hypothetical protein
LRHASEHHCRFPATAAAHPRQVRAVYSNGNKAAIREESASLATEADIEPNEVLLRTIRLTWGAVQWCASVIGQTEYALAGARNDDDPDVGADEKVKRVINQEKRLLALQAIYGDWIDRAAKHAKLALDAGIEERKVQPPRWKSS